MSRSRTMDHDYIERHQIIARYLRADLGSDEAGDFEQHYLSCETCLDALELDQAFRDGVRQMVTEEVARTAAAGRLGFLAWLARAARSPRAGILAAAALIALIVPLGMMNLQLSRVRERNVELSDRLSDALQPQRNTLILPLGPERAGPSTEPSVRIRLPEVPGWIVLSLELDRPEFATYRVSLLDAGGEIRWMGDDLVPNQLDSLAVSFHSSIFEAGDYSLQVEGGADGAGGAVAGRFAFRILPSP